MNECANCLLFQWEQPDIGDLQKCTRCKVLQYCSKECQKEHWMLVHKSQCKKFAEIKNFEGFVVDTFKITQHRGSHPAHAARTGYSREYERD